MDEQNPPLALPNGRVYSSSALLEMAGAREVRDSGRRGESEGERASERAREGSDQAQEWLRERGGLCSVCQRGGGLCWMSFPRGEGRLSALSV